MAKFLVLAVYNLLLPIFFIFAFPAWLVKMGRRGGFGTGLLERFSFFKEDALSERKGVIYIHAVSVGEVLIAIKLIKEWLEQYPDENVLLVPTTSTGHEVAKKYAPEDVRVIYSPLDFSFILKRVFKRFAPKQIILMESEIWPNMLQVAEKLSIPVNVANARLSPRSEKRYQKLGKFLRPMLGMLNQLCAQDEVDKKRWSSVGVANERITVTGSIKFDQSGSGKPQRSVEFAEILEGVSSTEKKVVMAISTHAEEESWIAESLLPIKDEICLVIVPRHAERRKEVRENLEALGYDVVLRSKYEKVLGACFVIDSTGELRDWTAHADMVIVGKSIIGKGGQNPTEAMAVSVPVLCGPYMRNFEPLITQLKQAEGIIEFENQSELVSSVQLLLGNQGELIEKQTKAALKVLESHQGATLRTVKVLSDVAR